MSWQETLQQDLDVEFKHNITLPGSGQGVDFKPTTTKTMKKLLAYGDVKDEAKIEEALDGLIYDSVLNDVDLDSFYLQDRIYLLFEIRRQSKGSSYKFDYTCPKCESQSIQNINLSDFKVKKKPKKYKKEIKVTKNISIKIDYITRGEQKIVLEFINNQQYDQEVEKLADLALITYSAAIKAVINGKDVEENITFTDKVHLIENVPEHVFENIKKWFSDNDFGVDMTHIRRCPHCGHKEDVNVPLSALF